jgi:hypothetical protein
VLRRGHITLAASERGGEFCGFRSCLRARRYGPWLVVGVLIGLCSPPRLGAQQASASINGSVTDQSNAAVVGATVTLTGVETGVTRSTVSNATGDYVFVDVLPAAYTIKVTKEGFATVDQPRFTMYVNQTATFNFHLQVGSTQQSITVEAQAEAIHTRSERPSIKRTEFYAIAGTHARCEPGQRGTEF